MRIGVVLRKWRNASELNLREVSDKIGIHHSTLARVEAGKNPPGDALVKILFWLVGEENANSASASGSNNGTVTADQESRDESVSAEGN